MSSFLHLTKDERTCEVHLKIRNMEARLNLLVHVVVVTQQEAKELLVHYRSISRLLPFIANKKQESSCQLKGFGLAKIEAAQDLFVFKVWKVMTASLHPEN